MYRVTQNSGDTVAVPHLVIARLADYDADEARFRVALHMLAGAGGTAESVAAALNLDIVKAASALAYWEGAGLLERSAAPAAAAEPKTALRKRLSAREVVQAGAQDPTLGMLVQEMQRVFGGVVSESDSCVFATLYMEDGFAADLILMCASYCASMGKVNSRYIEKVLFSWRREGITDCCTADMYLKQLALREQQEQQVAEIFCMDKPVFTLAERRRIAEWFEDFGYGKEMIEAARLAAGDKKGEVKYIHAILKKWFSSGHKTPKDVQMSGSGQNHNLRVDGSRDISPQQDILQQGGYVPMRQRGINT